jgi:uncharacterized protein (TIGR03435 family)
MSMNKCIVVCVAVITVGSRVAGQAPADGPRFEVASIRTLEPGGRCISTTSPYGQPAWTMGPAPLRAFVSMAFDVSKLQGLPTWDRTECFTMTAKAEDGVLLSREELRPRLKQLLVERMALVAHVETTYAEGYGLVIAKGGAKLKETADPPTLVAVGPGSMRARSVSMQLFARVLTGALYPALQQPVRDETGLTANYQFTLTYAPDGAVDSPLPSFFTALQEQLGLKLEGGRQAPVETLIIDHVERPTED